MAVLRPRRKLRQRDATPFRRLLLRWHQQAIEAAASAPPEPAIENQTAMDQDEDEDEANLFRAEVADARPVRDSGHVIPERPKPAPVPIHSMRDEDAALEEALAGPDFLSDAIEIGDAENYLAHGLPGKVLRDLVQGRWAVQDALDLHGLRLEEARAAVVVFLARSRKRGLRCVLIIHGKGYGSSTGEPVLRDRTRGWLMQKDEVLAFCDAAAGQGGAGAVTVLLKAS